MKRSCINLGTILFSALLLSGCTTIDYRAIEYGMTKAEVMDHLRIDEKDRNDALFRLLDSENHMYECYFFLLKKCYMDYYFLFQNSLLISIVQDNELSSFFQFEGFDESNDILPHENGFSSLLAPFTPPIPLDMIDPSEVDEERKEAWSHGRFQGVGMVIGLSPIWVPASPILLPMIIDDMNDNKEILANQRSIQLDDSYSGVMQILGEDKKRIIGDPETYGILIDDYYAWGPSFGFRDNKVIWIRSGFHAYKALPHGHKYRP